MNIFKSGENYAREVTDRKRAEEKLRTAEARYRSHIEVTGQIAWVTDPNGDIVEDVPSFRKFTGQTYEETKGSGWAKTLHPDDLERTLQVWNEAVATRTPYETEYRMRRHDGVYRHLLARAFPVLREDGSIQEWVGTLIDVSERKKAEDSLRISRDRLIFATEGANLGVWNWDTVSGELIWTEKCMALFGIPPDEVMSYPRFRDALHPDDRERTDKAVQDALDSHTDYDIEYRSLWPDGSIHWLAAKGRGFYDTTGKAVRLEGIVLDISDRKRAEEELQKHHDRLEQLVEERTAELQAMNNELEAFSYSVSHDLKAPLRSIDGFAKMLEEDYAERLDEEGRRLLRVVQDSARDMGQLINDLLTFSRLSRKDLKMTCIKMRTVVEEARRQVEKSAAGRTIRWDIRELPPAFGDEATVREVLVNLLSNAVKFTRPRQVAVITLAGSVEGDEVRFTVTDNGVGFDMAYKDKLFCVFQRLHSAEEFEGSGIGLALVQRIIQRHGGRVWAVGKVDEGATVEFTLPRKDGRGSKPADEATITEERQ